MKKKNDRIEGAESMSTKVDRGQKRTERDKVKEWRQGNNGRGRKETLMNKVPRQINNGHSHLVL